MAAIVVYDITSRRSFDKVPGWINELKDNSHGKVSVYLVGNKLDLAKQREVTYEEGYNYAKQNKLKFTETCAFELNTIEPMFKSLAEDVLAKIDSNEIDLKNEHMGVKVGSNKAQQASKKLKSPEGNKPASQKRQCCSS